MRFKDQKALGQEACISLTNQRRLLVLAERKEKVESWQLTEIVSIGHAVELTIW